MTRGMTPRLVKVDEALRSLHKEKGRLPTYKELMYALGDNTRGPIYRDLLRLQGQGKLKMMPRGSVPAVLL